MASRLPHYCIIGGGISGLATAYFLSIVKSPGTYRVSLLESGPRFGGWVQSIRNPDTGSVYELGPHSARATGPNSLLLRMACGLELENSIQWLCSDQDASKRYIYTGDQLVTVSPFQLIPTKPFTRSSAGLLVRRLFSPRPPSKSDISVDEFLRTRFDDEFADYLGSSMMRGIYAGDSRELSSRACLPSLVQSEELGPNLIIGLLRTAMTRRSSRSSSLPTPFETELGTLRSPIPRGAFAWSLSGGMQTLIDALVQRLHLLDPMISLQLNSSAHRIIRSTHRFAVQCTQHSSDELTILPDVDAIFLCCPSYKSAELLRELVPYEIATRLQKSHLPWASVAVSVLELDCSSSQSFVRGFGHLVPRLVDPYALGIVYDSVAFPQLDGPHHCARYTVMMKPRSEWLITKPPSLEQIILSESLTILKRHLKLDNVALVSHRSSLLPDCIPQYPVGHLDNISSVRSVLRSLTTEDCARTGGIHLVGFSYDGVSLGDAVSSALKAVVSTLSADSS